MKMRRLGLMLAILVLLTASPQVRAQSSLVDGQVTKVDTATGKITIRHGPFKKFDMDDPMTMVYPVQDPAINETGKFKLARLGEYPQQLGGAGNSHPLRVRMPAQRHAGDRHQKDGAASHTSNWPRWTASSPT